MEFEYKDEVLPKVVQREEGYERVKTIVPLTSGDIAIAFVSSQGEYDLIEIVGSGKVKVLWEH